MKVSNNTLRVTKAAIELVGDLQKAPKAAFALAKNHRRIVSELTEYESERKKLIKQHFGDAEKVDDKHPNWQAFHRDCATVLDIEVDFEPHKFSEDDLNLEQNEIKPAILSELLWLIEDAPK